MVSAIGTFTAVLLYFRYQQRIHHYRIIPNEEGMLSIQVSLTM